MPRIARAAVLLLLLLFLAAPAAGQDDTIAWSKDVATGLAKAKETGRILMICVNAKHVEGHEDDEEPAAKGLREVVYKDPRVVKRSRDFVCVIVTPTSGTNDYTELSLLGIGGKIISPQHIFVSPEGDRILLRKEYWSHGNGEKAVEALLALMDQAEGKSAGGADGEPGEWEAPEDGEARAAWIARMLAIATEDDFKRDKALQALVRADRDGDCTEPLLALLKEKKKDVDFLVSVIRALGHDGLEKAALPVSGFLGHREPSVRANAAVSLEYIGSRDKKVVAALMKAAGKEKDEAIANHVYRALGRCGVEDGKVRALLLKMTAAGKSEFATYGPAIGLAYFEEDKAARRGVEEILKQLGIPGGRRGGGQHTVKRGLVSWTLACIGDDKSAKFVREELIAGLKNVKAFWVEGMVGFWTQVAKKCEGDDEAMVGIEAGVRIFVGVAKRFSSTETPSLMDDSRTGRDNSGFKPRGDGLLDE